MVVKPVLTCECRALNLQTCFSSTHCETSSVMDVQVVPPVLQGTESKLFLQDMHTLPVIPNMMPTSPLAASHKTLLKTLSQGKASSAASSSGATSNRNRRQGTTTTTTTSSNSSDEEDPGIVERRVSVRQSESAFRYKEIVVKKCPGYTQIWLFTSTKIKNALNPKVSADAHSSQPLGYTFSNSRIPNFSLENFQNESDVMTPCCFRLVPRSFRSCARR